MTLSLKAYNKIFLVIFFINFLEFEVFCLNFVAIMKKELFYELATR